MWPKCEECEGIGSITNIAANNIPGNDEPPSKPCPACNGTGERDLTADEASEYISKNGCDWDQVLMANPDLGYDLWFITVYDNETQGAKYAKQVKAKKYTAALNAAAQAAKERGKE